MFMNIIEKFIFKLIRNNYFLILIFKLKIISSLYCQILLSPFIFVTNEK